MLVDPTSGCHERLGDACEILTRMDTGLIRIADTRPAHERNRLEVLRIETQLTRQLRLCPQLFQLISCRIAERRVKVPVHPLEARVDGVLTNDFVNRNDRDEPSVPHCLRVGASESFCQLAETRVGHHRQMSAGMSRVGRGATTTFEYDDAFAGLCEEVRGSETGDPTADDDYITFGI